MESIDLDFEVLGRSRLQIACRNNGVWISDLPRRKSCWIATQIEWPVLLS